MLRFKQFLASAACLGALLGGPVAAQAATVTYNGFADTTGLTTVGSTGTVVTGDGTVLRLTPSAIGQSGAAYSTTAITLGVNNTFSTQFQFRFTDPGGIDPADGITFVLAAATDGLGDAGGGLGYQGVGNSVAIEFDTYDNGETGQANHVGIDVNGSLASLATASPYGVADCYGTGVSPAGVVGRAGCMANGNLWTANIGYDGQFLSLRLRDGAGAQQLLIDNYAINLSTILGANQAFVGFTGATGSGYENQDIVNWSFSDTTSLANGVPEPATWAMMIMGFGLAGSVLRRRQATA